MSLRDSKASRGSRTAPSLPPPLVSAGKWRWSYGLDRRIEGLARSQPGDNLAYPSLTEGGSDLIFQSHRAGADIWKIDLSSAKPVAAERVTNTPWLKEQPAVSPDGRWLAFTSPQLGPSQRRSDYRVPAGFSDSPRWSPDGSLVYSAGIHRKTDGRTVEDRFVFRRQVLTRGMPSPGSPLRVTDAKPVGHAPVEEGRGSWSVDGKSVLLRSNRNGSAQIWKVTMDGRAEQLTEDGGYEAFAGPNGFVYYVHSRGPSELWRIPLDRAAPPELILRANPNDDWDGVHEGWWAINQRGIFVIQRERNNPGRTRLAQFDLDGKPTGKLPVDLSLQGGVRKGISVSAEGVLYWSAEHDPSSEVRRLALLGGK